jgi:hypothetical protein
LQSAEESLWKITTADKLDTSLHLQSIDFDLPLTKVYRQVPELQGEELGGLKLSLTSTPAKKQNSMLPSSIINSIIIPTPKSPGL